MPRANPTQEPQIQRKILDWYKGDRRNLPWRKKRLSSYAIWVSEIMLQQTRVEVVVPAYRRFIRTFPNLNSLASANEEEVLSQWSGLGYYSRARSLHRAAQLLQSRGARAFPSKVEEALSLPGVGRYTAAAVLSIAYDQPYAAVDANVTRVLSRIYLLDRPNSAGEPHQAIADQLLAKSSPGKWNQAMMAFGEVVCRPRIPKCDACDIYKYCEARKRNRVHEFPRPVHKKERERVTIEMFLIRSADGKLLLERGAFPYLKHLWLPAVEIADARHLDNSRAIGRIRHAIVHRSFKIELRYLRLSDSTIRRLLSTAKIRGIERKLFSRSDIEGLGRSSLLSKALAVLDTELATR